MKRYIGIIVFAVLLTSCDTLYWTTISVKKPAQVTVPSYIQNIVVVNNAAQQPDNTGHKNIKYSHEENIEVSSDSVNIILIESLAQFMNEENYYGTVKPYFNPIEETKNFLSNTPLDSMTVKEICRKTNADAIISLDRLIMKSELKTENAGNSLVSDILNVKVNALFRMYDENGTLLFPPFTFHDTLTWQNIHQDDFYIRKEIDSRKKALHSSALFVADQMVYQFVPFWQEQYRWYYSDISTKMREAATKAEADKWHEAALIWGEIYEKEKKKNKKAKIALNIGLANEMLDNIENALNWVNISYELFSSEENKEAKENVEQILLYKLELEERLKDFKKLDIQ